MTDRYESFVTANLNVVGRTGDELCCTCPFHDDRGRPNLYVNVQRGLFICHSCQERGHIRQLAARLGVPLRDAGVPLSHLQNRLDRLGDVGRRERSLPESYLGQFAYEHEFWTDVRGFSERTIQTWGLGYDPIKDQGIIPFRNPRGELLGVIRRRFDGGKPRYIYPRRSAFRKHLFGAWMVKTKKVALVEGPLDVIACWDSRVPALGLMGSVLTADQMRALTSMGVQTVVVMTDNDNAGRAAAHQIKDSLSGITVKVGSYRRYWIGQDPGELKPVQRRKMFHSSVPWSERPDYLREEKRG